MDPSAPPLDQLEQWIAEIEGLDVEALARQAGFQKRSQRKIATRDLLRGMLAVAASVRLSFERVAASIARCAAKTYSKQALQQRLDGSVVALLAAVFVQCFKPVVREASTKGIFAAFGRVLLHDSTCIALPSRHAGDFPGSANRRAAFSQIKAQLICDLLDERVEQVSLSGFTRNDQRAAADILEVLRPGDLVIRDLGYFVLSIFREIAKRSAFFLSRYRHGVTVLDAETRRPIPLARLLKKQGFFDAQVLLGTEEKLPVRLVAVPVPDAVANARRRKLRQNRDQSLNPGTEHLFLLGWNIFITNVGPEVWGAKSFPVVYRLRWRIETLFKAWKSHLKLTELSDQCPAMIRLSVMSRLIFCAFATRTCVHLETLGRRAGRHASILRVTSVLGGLSILYEAALVGLTPQQLLHHLLDQHAYYEKRADRKNFQQILSELSEPLG